MSGAPVSHFHFEQSVSTSPRKAAEWAWTCLENLCSSFCKNFCETESKCSLEHSLKVDNKIDLEDAQKAFHQAIAYLPAIESVDNECPACLVTKALKTFPLIAARSEVTPVSEMKMNAIDCYPEVVPMGLNAKMSFPCCVITTLLVDSERTIETRCREMALLNLNIDELPAIPPWEYESIGNVFIAGQTVVKKLWAIKQGEPTEEIIKTELFRQNITNAIAATLCLRDLIHIKCFYPNAVPERDFQSLQDSLTEWIGSSVSNEPFLKKIFDGLYKEEISNKLSLLDSLSAFYSAMLQHHPDWSSCDDDSEQTKDSISKLMQKCIEESYQPIKDIADFIVNAKLKKCIYPTPKDQPAFRSESRYFKMFREYWLLCRTAITDRTSHEIGWHPSPLSSLVINLKQRIDVCINGMIENGSEIGQEVRSDLEYLIEALLHWDVDEISIGGENLLNMLQGLDLWLNETEIKLGPCLTGMTSEEQTYIEYASQQISDYDRKAKTSFMRMLENADKEANVIKKKVSKEPQKENSPVAFLLPTGARWEDLSIIFSDGHIVTVKYKDTRKRFNYSQMGMGSLKSGEPTKQWELLQNFANSYGQIEWQSTYASNKLKKQKQELSKCLKKFFQLKDDPIKWDKGDKVYRCRFRILPDNDDDY